MRKLLVALFVTLPLVIGLVVWETNAFERARRYAILEGFVMPRGTVYVGDSLTREMPWKNYGVRGLTTRQLVSILPHFRGADRIVITIGTNDLLTGVTPQFSQIAAFDRPIVWIGLHRNRMVDVDAANDAIRAVCKAPHCEFVDPGEVPLQADGLHIADYAGIERRLHQVPSL